jgi:uncharacterized protein YbjT (DUF2867 family)
MLVKESSDLTIQLDCVIQLTHGNRMFKKFALAVRAAFADALLIRPAVMFGSDDAFLTTILKLLRRLPIYPMFGRGLTGLQPAFVEDVAAEAVASALQGTERHAITYECGGPRVYSYEEFLRAVAHEAGR